MHQLKHYIAVLSFVTSRLVQIHDFALSTHYITYNMYSGVSMAGQTLLNTQDHQYLVGPLHFTRKKNHSKTNNIFNICVVTPDILSIIICI